MRIVAFAHGTRGDVAPLVALSWLLKTQGHEVTIAVPDEFRDFAERAGLRTAPLPLDTMAWLRTRTGQRLLHSGGIAFMRGLAREYERRADDLDDAFIAASHGAEALVANHITGDRTMLLGDALQVPVAFHIPFPITPSREYAPLLLGHGRLPSPALHGASHDLLLRFWSRANARSVRVLRDKLGLPRSRQPLFRRAVRDDAYLVLYSLSRNLFPRPSDWPDHIEVTAPWRLPAALRADLGETLPDDLANWLDAGERPIFLGFGSMPVLAPEPLLRDIVAVTEELGVRAIVSENCVAASAAGSLPERLRVVGAVDHDRLFPRCAAAVHHGGIGSLTASLGAGLPTLVCSVFGDQPWWGEHAKRLGVGAHVPFRKLDRERLRAGLSVLLDPPVRARAQRLGDAIRAEGDGLAAAGRTFEEWLSTRRMNPQKTLGRTEHDGDDPWEATS